MPQLHAPGVRAPLLGVRGYSSGVQLSAPRASCSFVLLFATLCYFCYFCYFCLLFANTHSPKHSPTVTCAPAARARRQSTSVRCQGGVRLEYSSPHPGLLAALCYFLLLCATFATFAYFSPIPTAITHPPTANLCSSCTRTALWHVCRVWGWPCGIQLPTPWASCNFVQLCATFATFATFAYFSPIPTAKSTRLR